MNKVVYIEKNDIYSTLTTWIYCAFHMAYTAKKHGIAACINWTRGKSLQALDDEIMFNKIPNQYEWYFDQSFTCIGDYRSATWLWESQGWGHNIKDENFMSQPLLTIKEYYKKHLHFNSLTDERGNQLVNKYNIDFSKTIGISWRGTDIYLDGRPRLPIEIYFPFIDDILNDNPDFRIMATAEEQGILEPLLKRYPNAFVIDEFVSAPNGAKNNPEKLAIDKRSGYEKGLQSVLMVWLFSKCAYYIKNRSSTGAVASWLSNGTIISLGHPENLGYEAAGDYYEINGQRKTPLYR